MKKFIVAPDSFKGTLSSGEACEIISATIKQQYPAAEVIALPIADGGEGTVAAFLSALGGERVGVTVTGPDFVPVPAFYGLLPDGTAVLEMAAAAGLPLCKGRSTVESSTTFGVGELIVHALRGGARRIILGLGGSGTNDGGCGMAAALGVVFRNAGGEEFIPTGGSLGQIASINIKGLLPELRASSLTCICDVTNPLCGENGAAAVYGPQKGADAAAVRRLDAGLAHLAEVIASELGLEVGDLEGAGAAGGMGAGCVAFLGGLLQRGIKVLLATWQFSELIKGTELVITGEGRCDRQSFMGKVVGGIAAECKAAGIPCACLVGEAAVSAEEAAGYGVTTLLGINPPGLSFEEAGRQARENLAVTVRGLLGKQDF